MSLSTIHAVSSDTHTRIIGNDNFVIIVNLNISKMSLRKKMGIQHTLQLKLPQLSDFFGHSIYCLCTFVHCYDCF